MRIGFLALALMLLAVLWELRSATRHTPAAPAGLVWVTAGSLLAALVLATLRTVRSLPSAPVEESRRGLFLIALLGLALVYLALSLAGLAGA